MKEIIEKIIQFVGDDLVLLDEPMRNHTSFKIGGPAVALVQPDTVEKLQQVVKFLNQQEVKFYILGNGTNVLFPDEGYKGIVVKIADNLSEIRIEGERVYAEAGALLSRVSKMSAKESLTGLEFASGIPGTIGGAVVMNAGAYGGEMKDIITEVTVIDETGQIKVYQSDNLNFGYRTSVVKEKGYTVLTAVMNLKKGNPDEIMDKMNELNQKRTTKQPLNLPSAGSTFKRPPGHYAGKLIEDSGLKGLIHGGAQVSDLHCGFVVNVNHATYEDVVTLISIVRDTVNEKFGVELEPEIKIIERD